MVDQLVIHQSIQSDWLETPSSDPRDLAGNLTLDWLIPLPPPEAKQFVKSPVQQGISSREQNKHNLVLTQVLAIFFDKDVYMMNLYWKESAPLFRSTRKHADGL